MVLTERDRRGRVDRALLAIRTLALVSRAPRVVPRHQG
jgi:hypothetical protein